MDIQTLFDPDNAVWSFLQKLYSLALAGLLWLVCSLPIITLGPATIALFSYCFSVLDDTESYVFKTFFISFGKTWKQGSVIALLFLLVMFFLGLDAWFFLSAMPPLFFVAVSLFLLVLFPCLHIFALMSLRTRGVKTYIQQAFIISIKHAATTITVLSIVALWFLSIYALPISILFSAGPACVLVSMFLRALYKRIGVYKTI